MTPTKPPVPPTPAVPAVIRRIDGAKENARFVRKHVPAWVVSGAVHVALIATLLLIDRFTTRPDKVLAADQGIVVTDTKPDEAKDVTPPNPFEGVDPELEPSVITPKVDDNTVESHLPPSETPGVPEAVQNMKLDVPAPPGTSTGDFAGLAGDQGTIQVGQSCRADGNLQGQFSVRGGGPATRVQKFASGGITDKSELAVGRGLAWLALQQKRDGSWAFDGSSSDATAASTALALLPFLAAGQTHRKFAENKYQTNVLQAVNHLIDLQMPDGSFKRSGPQQMYAHAIATVALCELYGMTGDKAKLHGPASRAVGFLVAAQGSDGSWGYRPRTTGDTSIVGWQIQALHSAKLCKDILVPDEAFKKARGLLDKVSDTSKHAVYGYTDRTGGRPSLTAVGLLSRYYGDKWGPNNPGMAAGVGYLMKNWMPSRDRFDMYYYYYATQVMHFYDGPEWHQDWNPKMRDMLIDMQVPPTNALNAGSWDSDKGTIGQHCGRLGTTCLALLTLEVYYRHLPLYKRDTGGIRELDR